MFQRLVENRNLDLFFRINIKLIIHESKIL